MGTTKCTPSYIHISGGRYSRETASAFGDRYSVSKPKRIVGSPSVKQTLRDTAPLPPEAFAVRESPGIIFRRVIPATASQRL